MVMDLARTQREVLSADASGKGAEDSALYCDNEDRDSLLRDEIHAIAWIGRCTDTERSTAQLKLQGHVVSGKRIRRILKEEGLICRRRDSDTQAR